MKLKPHSALTSVQRLRLARAITANSLRKKVGQVELLRAKPQRTFVRFQNLASGNFESAAAWFWNKLQPQALCSCNDPTEAAFLFKCFYTPLFAAIEIGSNRWTLPKTPLWLFEPATYLIALERTHIEMVLSVTSSSPKSEFQGVTWERPHRIRNFKDLPGPTISWFLAHPGKASHWMGRFEAWRAAAMDSFGYWLRMRSGDIDDLPSKLSRAAIVGTIGHFSSFPAGTLEGIIDRLQRSHKEALEVLFKNLAKPEPFNYGDHPQIDSWLVEVWPLVRQEKWNYSRVSDVAQKKFRSLKLLPTDRGAIETRCERLNLRLHPSVQRGGRSSNAMRRPLAELMAIWVESISANGHAWLLGQRGLTGMGKPVVQTR